MSNIVEVKNDSLGNTWLGVILSIVLIYTINRGCTMKVVTPESTTTYHIDMNEAQED